MKVRSVGFALIELMIVVAIMSIVVAFFLNMYMGRTPDPSAPTFTVEDLARRYVEMARPDLTVAKVLPCSLGRVWTYYCDVSTFDKHEQYSIVPTVCNMNNQVCMLRTGDERL